MLFSSRNILPINTVGKYLGKAQKSKLPEASGTMASLIGVYCEAEGCGEEGDKKGEDLEVPGHLDWSHHTVQSITNNVSLQTRTITIINLNINMKIITIRSWTVNNANCLKKILMLLSSSKKSKPPLTNE